MSEEKNPEGPQSTNPIRAYVGALLVHVGMVTLLDLAFALTELLVLFGFGWLLVRITGGAYGIDEQALMRASTWLAALYLMLILVVSRARYVRFAREYSLDRDTSGKTSTEEPPES